MVEVLKKYAQGARFMPVSDKPGFPQVVFDKPDDGAGTPDPNDESDSKEDENSDDDEDESDLKKTDDDKGKTELEKLRSELEKEKAEKAKLLKETMKRKDAQKKIEEELAKFKDVDPEKYRELMAEKTDAEKKAAEAAGDFQRVKQMMADQHKSEVESLKSEINSLKEQLTNANTNIDKLSIGNSFNSSKFITENMIIPPSKAKIIYGDHFEVKDGQLVGYDKPSTASERTMLVDGTGSPLSFDKAIETIINSDPDKDNILKSSVKNGGGSKTEDIKPKEKDKKVGTGIDRISQALTKKLNKNE